MEIIERRSGYLCLRASGNGAAEAFGNEGGGHRWQRVPPTEKRGRVHTSTVTVAVLPVPENADLVLRDEDLEFKACRGSGAGGQHRNVTDSAVTLRHKPSGLTVRCESERSQHQNRASAMALLRARLFAQQTASAEASRNSDRRNQVGSGMRGDKRRTIRLQANQVVDHVLGRRMRASDYLRGDLAPFYT